MASTWRRVADWKQTIRLVRVADIEKPLWDAHDWTTPAAAIRDRWPRLAELATATGFARVDARVAAVLHANDVPTYEVGYHRGSDGFLFAEENRHGRTEKNLAMAALVQVVLDGADDDETYDRVRDDTVDALLRILSENDLTERAAIVAALVPPLGAKAESGRDDNELDAHETLDPAALPQVTPAFVEAVAAALARFESSPPPREPHLLPEARRAFQKQAATVGMIALALGLVGGYWAPFVAVFAVPVVVLCVVVIVLHAIALRQDPRR